MKYIFDNSVYRKFIGSVLELSNFIEMEIELLIIFFFTDLLLHREIKIKYINNNISKIYWICFGTIKTICCTTLLVKKKPYLWSPHQPFQTSGYIIYVYVYLYNQKLQSLSPAKHHQKGKFQSSSSPIRKLRNLKIIQKTLVGYGMFSGNVNP